MVRNTRLAKCLVISCVANGLLVCAVGSSRLLHPAANVTELLRPVPVSSYKPRPLASKPVVKRQVVEVQPTPAPQTDSSKQKASAKQEAASGPAAKLTTGAKAFAGAKASAKKLASAPQKTGAAKVAEAKTGGHAKEQGSTRMAKAAGGASKVRAAKAGGAHERAVAAKRSEAAAALRAAKAQLVSARNAQRQAERKVAAAKRALFEAQRKRESLSSARVAATQARQTLAQTQRDFHSALLSARRTPEDMQKLAMEASFKTIAANSNADLKAKQAQSKEAQDAANQAMKEATQALEEASRQATASSAAQQELIAKLNNLSRVSKGKAPAVSTGSMASGGQEIKAEADEKPGEQEPEKQTKKHKPVTRIVLKTIKMWAPKPGQKLSLPTNLEIVLSNDLKVIPGPPLDEDQLAELAQMMAKRNLQQVKMNRRQLKALLETRRQSESRKPKPKPKESENADASEQGRHREGKKPEREKKASTGEKKPKDPNANLKKPNTPFQVRQWDTDMSQRWAKRVRDESEMGTNDGAQTPKPNQPAPSNSNDAAQPNGNQGAAPENNAQGTPAAGGAQNPLMGQAPQTGNAQGGNAGQGANAGNGNNGAAGAGGANAGGANAGANAGGAGQNGAQGATAGTNTEGTQGNGQSGDGKGAAGADGNTAGGNNAGGNNQGVAGAGGNGTGGNGAGANGTGGNGQGVTGQGANGNAQGAGGQGGGGKGVGGGQGGSGSGNGQGVGGGNGSGNGQGVGGGSGSGNGQGVGGGGGSGNGQGVGGGSGSGNGQGVGGGSGSGGGQGVGGGSGSGGGQGVGGGSGSGSGSGNGQGVGSGSGSGSGSGGGNGQGVGSGGSGPGSDGNGGGGNGIGEGDGGEGEAGAEYSGDGGGSAGALSGEGGDGGGWDTDIETRDDGQGVDSKKGDQNKTEVDLPPDAPVGGHTIPGGLVLPPVPPVGTENGKAKTLRQVSPSTVQVPTQERKAVSGRSAVPPVPGGATDQNRRAIPPQRNNPTRLAMRPGARMVAQNTAEPQKMQPAPQGDPQRAVKKAVPRALTIGSTSSRGTVAFTVMPRPSLPLGSVTDVIDPNLPPANGVAKSKTVAMKHQATPAMKQPVLAPAGMPTRPVFKVVPPVPPVQPKARPGILAQKPVAAIKAHSGQIKLAHNSEGVKEGSEQPLPAAPLPGNMDQIGDGSGLKGDYYLGNAFNEFIFSRADANINFTFSSVLPDHSPNPRIPAFADYTARWTGRIAATHSETYTFYAAVDDGIRVWIDHKLVLDQWGPHSPIQFSSQFTFEAGRQYLFKCEYMATDGGTSLIHLYWESPSTPKQFVPQDSFFYPLATDEIELEKDKGPQIIR